MITSSSHKISCLIPSYNEAERIEAVILSATQWADEIILIDKSSTDNTRDLALAASSKVRIVTRPFSEKGDDDFLEYIEYPQNDWIFILTCSEIPTRKLIKEAILLLEEKGDVLEILYIPRRMFSLGLNQAGSPWHISYYPFFFHRRRCKIQNTIHDNIHPFNSSQTTRIPYTEDCCVYHFTHPSVRDMMKATLIYAEIESTKPNDSSPQKKILHCFKNIQKATFSISKIRGDWIPALCGWAIYWLTTALYIWEKHKGYDVPKLYSQWRKELLNNEWGQSTPSAILLQSPASPFKLKLWQRILSATLQMPYYLAKWIKMR